MSRLHHDAKIANARSAPIDRLFGENHSLLSAYGVPALRNAVGQTRKEKPQAAYPTRYRFLHADRMELLLAITSPDIEQCPAWLVLAFERGSVIDRDELSR